MKHATRKAARELHAPEDRVPSGAWISHAINAAGDVVYEWDLETGAMRWSGDPVAAFGLGSGPPPSGRGELLALVHPDDVAAIDDKLGRHLQAAAPFDVEYRLRGDAVAICWVQDRGAAEFGPDGIARRVRGVLRQVTERKRHENRLERRANYDELTGHFNLGRLREALDHAHAYARRYGSDGAYVVVVIDDLALLGDVYGREVADAALIAVGQQLDRCVRESDIVGRLGPDRFGVVLDGCPRSKMDAAVAKIAAAVTGTPVPCDFGPLHITAAVCAIAFPRDESTAVEIMSRAERGARLGGKDIRLTIAGRGSAGSHDGEVHQDLAMAERLRWCLQNDSVGLAFQPVVASDTGEVAFHECLMRLVGEGAMPHGAGPMIKVAERTGLIRQIDTRILELAIGELEAAGELRLAINVSGLTTADRPWLRRLVALVQGRGDLAQRLTVEITETAAMLDLAESTRFVATLRDMGCHVALDDFGAGHTSFRNLKVLAVDLVKIDGSFIAGLAEQPTDIAFIAVLQNLANACGLATVAEWVEDAATARLLTDHGVTYQQGYHHGRPTMQRPWQSSGKSRIATIGPIR